MLSVYIVEANKAQQKHAFLKKPGGNIFLSSEIELP